MGAKTYDRQSGKFLARIAENLPELSGDVMQSWIDDPKALQKFLLGLSQPTAPKKFAVWKTITLGTDLKTAADFRKALKANGNLIGNYADDTIGKPAFTVSETEKEVDLVQVTVEELGFENGADYANICAKAKTLGLELCTTEVGPQLRLRYKDQPKGEWLIVAMKAIACSDGDFSVFGIGHNGIGCWLDGGNGSADCFWNADSRFVFVLS